jgi:transcriptional regulator GlxA family with amidase domain
VLTDVTVIALPGVAPFELGVLCEVFGIDRTDQGVPSPSFAVVTPTPGPVPTSAGFSLNVEHDLSRAASADLVAVPAFPRGADVPGAVVDVLRAAVDRGGRVLSVCSGAWALGAAGLLDGRRCTTHWAFADELARDFPRARVDPGVLYVEDGRVMTSAGTAAGIDAALHLVRLEHGAAVASTIARRMVVPPHRDGGQAQFVAPAVPACADEGFDPVLGWMLDHLADDLRVEGVAAQAAMSPRTFARRFRLVGLAAVAAGPRAAGGHGPAGGGRRAPGGLRLRRRASVALLRARHHAAGLPAHVRRPSSGLSRARARTRARARA